MCIEWNTSLLFGVITVPMMSHVEGPSLLNPMLSSYLLLEFQCLTHFRKSNDSQTKGHCLLLFDFRSNIQATRRPATTTRTCHQILSLCHAAPAGFPATCHQNLCPKAAIGLWPMSLAAVVTSMLMTNRLLILNSAYIIRSECASIRPTAPISATLALAIRITAAATT